MPIEILMPALSPTMTEGNLSKWRKKEGDKIKSGEVLAEIETDKATMEVEAVDEGILGKIIITEGTNGVKVNSLIALILEDGESKDALANYEVKVVIPITASQKNEIKSPAVIASDTQKKSAGERIFASPLAKKIAEQNKIDISKITGTGPRGRVVKADILGSGSKCHSYSNNCERIAEEFEVVPLSMMRKVIATRLVESKQNIPHFYLSIDCVMDNLLTMREDINKHFASQNNNIKISVNDFIIKAVAMALRDVPDANASWAETEIHRYNNIDISVAVAIDGGLITPIIKNADFKSLSKISLEMKDLAVRARANALAPHEFQGGGFSISNLGMYGIKKFEAIISPPQSCILAVGATTKRPVVEGDAIKIANIVDLTISCDHRVVDGTIGSLFLAALKKYIESPVLMMMERV